MPCGISNNLYYARTIDRQYEIARLVAQLDRGIDSFQSRMNGIDRKAESISTEPVKIRDLRHEPGPILNLSGQLDMSDISGLIKPEASRVSRELQKHIEEMTIEPVMIESENKLPDNVKSSLAQVRRVTLETIQALLLGQGTAGVRIENYRLLKQDGNIYDVEVLTEEGDKKKWIRSKICLTQNGSFTIHQTDEHLRSTKVCDKVAKQITATVDLALAKAYAQRLGLPKDSRSISGPVVVGNSLVNLQKSMCG